MAQAEMVTIAFTSFNRVGIAPRSLRLAAD